MPDVITGSTALAALYPSEVISKEVAESLQAESKIARYVWIETDESSLVIKFGKLPILTAAGYTDTDGMPLVGFSPTSASVTAAPVGVAVRITGVGSTLRPSSVFEAASEEGKALGAKIDTDLAALFASVTPNVGTTTTALTLAKLLSAIGKLNAAKVSQDGRVAIVGTTGYNDLLADAQTTNQFAFRDAAISGQIPMLYGVPVEFSPLLATANSGADNVGCVFQRRAFGLGMVKIPTSDIGKAPIQYDGIDIASKAYYGVALIDTNRAVKTISRV